MVGPQLARRCLAALVAGSLVGPIQAVQASNKAEGTAEDAQTKGARAAILPLSVVGELSDVDRARLTEELVEGLRRGAFAVVPPEEVAAADAKASECSAPGCFKRIAKATGATHLVRARITLRDRDYDVAVELIEGDSGIVLASSQEGCEICGIADAGNLVTSAAATLRTKLDALAEGPSTLAVTSEPAGAVVSIDGQIVGTTPLRRPVVPGKRVVRVSKDGYIGIEREVTFVEGVAETLTFELDKLPSRLPSRPWGWASMSVGLLALGGGFALIGIHDMPYKVGDDCKSDNVDSNGQCRYLWDTKWAGVSTAVVGAALFTLGIAILLNTSKSTRKEGAQPRTKRGRSKAKTRFGVGPGNVSFAGEF